MVEYSWLPCIERDCREPVKYGIFPSISYFTSAFFQYPTLVVLSSLFARYKFIFTPYAKYTLSQLTPTVFITVRILQARSFVENNEPIIEHEDLASCGLACVLINHCSCIPG